MRTNRATAYVGVKQATNVFHAVRYSRELGEMNRLVTINFHELGVPAARASETCQLVRRNLTRMWGYERGKDPCVGSFKYTAVQEAANDIPHVHWLMHMPDGFDVRFYQALSRQLQKVSGQRELGSALHVLKVDAPGTMAKYILKGVSPAYAEYFRMAAVNQGVVIGRRVAVSRSLSWTARKQAGWSRKG